MRILPIVLCLLLCVTCAQGANASTIFSDNFNGENGGIGTFNYTGFANWTVSGGVVDLIGNGFFEYVPDQGMYVDLDGTFVSQPGLLSSTPISLTAGTYSLQFALAGSQRGDTNTVQVALGSLYSEAFTLESEAPLSLITRTFTVDGPETASLTFQNSGEDQLGLILDDVSLEMEDVVEVAAVVPAPEPVSLSLMALGLAGITLLQLRVRRRAVNPA